MSRETTACFTGHRPGELWGYEKTRENIPNPLDINYDHLQQFILNTILPNLYERGYRRFLTGGAQGLDMVAFNAINEFKAIHPEVENVVYASCEGQESKWGQYGRFGQKSYQTMINQADEVHAFAPKWTPGCELARNQGMINDSSAVFALNNFPLYVRGSDLTPEEKEAQKKSGTVATLKMAEKEVDYLILEAKIEDRGIIPPRFNWYPRYSVGPTLRQATRKEVINNEGKNQNPVPEMPAFSNVLALDTETTGFMRKSGPDKYGRIKPQDEMLQIAVVDDAGHEWQTYIKPDRKEEWKSAQAINHISPEMVKNAPSASSVTEKLLPVFKRAARIVGHNVKFDLEFLANAGLHITSDRWDLWDTCTYFKKDHPEGKHSLTDAVRYYLGEEAVNEFSQGAHDAFTDTRFTMKVYQEQLRREIEKYNTTGQFIAPVIFSGDIDESKMQMLGDTFVFCGPQVQQEQSQTQAQVVESQPQDIVVENTVVETTSYPVDEIEDYTVSDIGMEIELN